MSWIKNTCSKKYEKIVKEGVPSGQTNSIARSPCEQTKALCPSTVGTQDVEASYEEAPPDERRVTLVTHEAVVVPVTLVERYELGGA